MYNACFTRDDAEHTDKPAGTGKTLQQVREYLEQDPRNAVIFTDAAIFLARTADDKSYYTANYPVCDPDDVIYEGYEDPEKIAELTFEAIWPQP